MSKGVIRQLNREGGSGIIRTERGQDLSFDHNQLQGMHFTSRLEGQQVEYEIGQGSDGRPRAIRIRFAKSRS